ncbi:hypothetical protein ANO14919_140840 [Xylariales sp. No.14919]|nr:hypothetical protein ANO14919_140840 [Xylariales sp. No.14919]
MLAKTRANLTIREWKNFISTAPRTGIYDGGCRAAVLPPAREVEQLSKSQGQRRVARKGVTVVMGPRERSRPWEAGIWGQFLSSTDSLNGVEMTMQKGGLLFEPDIHAAYSLGTNPLGPPQVLTGSHRNKTKGKGVGWNASWLPSG